MINEPLDRPFHAFRASKSAYRQIVCTLEKSIHDFRGSIISKSSVGHDIRILWIPRTSKRPPAQLKMYEHHSKLQMTAPYTQVQFRSLKSVPQRS